MTVTVVESNRGTRQGLVRRLLQMPGIHVVGDAGDPHEALRVVAEQHPDVIVLDPRWIAVDGAQFLQQIAAAVPDAGIVVLTAYLNEWERSDLIRAGAHAIQLKEINSGALVRTIRMAAGRLSPNGTGPPGRGERA